MKKYNTYAAVFFSVIGCVLLSLALNNNLLGVSIYFILMALDYILKGRNEI